MPILLKIAYPASLVELSYTAQYKYIPAKIISIAKAYCSPSNTSRTSTRSILIQYVGAAL